MKAFVRHTITIAFLLLFAAVLLLIGRQRDEDRREITCNGLKVDIVEPYHFVDEDDVKGYLDTHYGAYIGQRLDSLQLHRIEDILDRQSAILKSEAYTTDDGTLNIRITQREPVVRFQRGDDGFYADVKGFIFPLQDGYTSRVPVIDGDIPLSGGKDYKGAPVGSEETDWMHSVIGMLEYMQRSRIWAENIVQMHVDENGDLVLVPRDGDEVFIFGEPHSVADKFSRIEDYYRFIKPAKEEGYYKTVNVKYDNQIICKK